MILIHLGLLFIHWSILTYIWSWIWGDFRVCKKTQQMLMLQYCGVKYSVLCLNFPRLFLQFKESVPQFHCFFHYSTVTQKCFNPCILESWAKTCLCWGSKTLEILLSNFQILKKSVLDTADFLNLLYMGTLLSWNYKHIFL